MLATRFGVTEDAATRHATMRAFAQIGARFNAAELESPDPRRYAPYTRAELAAEVSRQTGQDVRYRNLSEREYEKVLSAFIPADLAALVADAEAQAAHGALGDHSHTLRRLLGRPTTSLAEAVASALKMPPHSR